MHTVFGLTIIFFSAKLLSGNAIAGTQQINNLCYKNRYLTSLIDIVKKHVEIIVSSGSGIYRTK